MTTVATTSYRNVPVFLVHRGSIECQSGNRNDCSEDARKSMHFLVPDAVRLGAVRQDYGVAMARSLYGDGTMVARWCCGGAAVLYRCNFTAVVAV